MIKKEEVYKIGILNKPHGVQGELRFTFTDDIFSRTDVDYIICLMDGILVPFYIEEYRFRSDNVALIKLEGIDTAEQAKRFINVEVFFPISCTNETQDHELTWDFFIGFQLNDTQYGHLGEIIEIDASTTNTLFIVKKNNDEILVPAHEAFIQAIDRSKRLITVTLPEGLLHIDKAEEV